MTKRIHGDEVNIFITRITEMFGEGHAGWSPENT
jgi:hypothetical protein